MNPSIALRVAILEKMVVLSGIKTRFTPCNACEIAQLGERSRRLLVVEIKAVERLALVHDAQSFT